MCHPRDGARCTLRRFALSAAGLLMTLSNCSRNWRWSMGRTPTAQTAGADFTVLATYKLKTGQQAYTIVVDGVTLQVTSISAGYAHTCAGTTAGGAKCWGNNAHGELGDGTLQRKSTPREVFGLASGVASISAGTYHTCAVTTGGAANCWGYNYSGQLGDGTLVQKSKPVVVSGLGSGVASISPGSDHTCALTTAGDAKCWGYGGSGQLGNGSTGASTTPVAVSDLASGVVGLEVGAGHACAVTTAGAVKCWGLNNNGQLGDGTVLKKLTPVAVAGLASGVAGISVGYYHNCAVTTTGDVKCWGANSSGQLGDGTTVNKSTPVAALGLAPGVGGVTAGNGYTCAVTAGGAAKCWGTNSLGQLGDGTTVDKSTPVDVLGLGSGVVSLSAGLNHACAATVSGALKCWGANGSGQLGDGTLVNKSTPVGVLP